MENKAAHKASIKTAIKELLSDNAGDLLDNNEITADQLFQLQNTLDDMDQGHVNLTTENCTEPRCHECPTPKEYYDECASDHMEEFIDTILPPQSGDDEDKDLLPQDVIKTLNAPAQLYIPPIPDIMLTEGQNLHFTDFDVHAEHNDEDKAFIRLVVQLQITQSDIGAN